MENRSEMTISVKDILFHIVKRWKIIFLFTISVFLLIGAMSLIQINNNSGTDDAASSPEDSLLFEAFSSKKKNLDQLYLYANEFYTNSIYARINPYKKAKAAQIFYVKDNSESKSITVNDSTIQISDNEVSAALAVINTYIQYSIDYSPLADAVGLKDGSYVREMVGTEVGDGYLSIFVNADTIENASIVMQFINEEVDKNANSLLANIGDLECYAAVGGVQIVPETNQFKWQLNTADDVTQIDAARNNWNSKYASFMEKDSNTGKTNIKSIIKRCIKYSVIAFIGICLAIALSLILKDVVLSPEDIRYLFGINIIGTIHKDSLHRSESKDSLPIASEEIKARCSVKDNVAVVCDCGQESSNNIYSELSKYLKDYSLVCLNDPINNVSDRRNLLNAKQLVLVVKDEKSRRSFIKQIVSLAVDHGIEICGALYVYD